jgi:hypothetical protein
MGIKKTKTVEGLRDEFTDPNDSGGFRKLYALEELDIGTVFDLALEEIAREEENGTAKHCVSEALPESAASIEETILEDAVKRLGELFSGPAAQSKGDGQEAELDEERYQQAKPLFDIVFSHLMRNKA